MTAAIAARAECAGARARLERWHPLASAGERASENSRLAEAIRRQSEPGAWCAVGRGELAARLETGSGEPLDGEGLVETLTWLEAARETRSEWSEEERRARFSALAGLADRVPALDALRDRLALALEPDGRVRDAASPALARARVAVDQGERRVQHQLEKWARGFGETAYVTRHGDRFVALVPAAGFPRRRGIVHDVSGSGQSLFVEPLEMCEANNLLIEQRAVAAEEERRVLRALAQAVRESAPELRALEETLIQFDTLRARARWAREFDAIAIEPGGETLRLRSARHPLLAMGESRERLVPLDLELGAGSRVLLVSGPNMGGKTVVLKTVGLATALSHAALPVTAAEGSRVPEIEVLLADLGDEQSVEQGISTFAAHLRALRTMAEQAGPKSLLLCDELGAGTDPEEGAALGRALIEHFAERGAWGVITTHLGSLKRVPAEIDGVASGSLEFDLETLTPRYRFIAGIPGASHALSVAERLGFPRPLLERARALTPGETRALERLLASLGATREEFEQETELLKAARAETQQAATAHREAAENAKHALEDLRRRLTSESQALLARARELWQTVQREARRAEKSRESATRLRTEMEALERGVESLERAAAPAETSASTPVTSLAAGQRVRVTDLGIEAEVVSGPDAEGRVLVRRGSWSIRTHSSKLAVATESASRGGVAGPAAGARWEAPDEAPALELDLRGMEVEEALSALDHGLDRALLAGLRELRIVHGIGRGVLRAAVERHLRGHPQVESQRIGELQDGGRGVTLARLR